MDTLKLIHLNLFPEGNEKGNACYIFLLFLQQGNGGTDLIANKSVTVENAWVIELWRLCIWAQTPQICELRSVLSFTSDSDNFLVSRGGRLSAFDCRFMRTGNISSPVLVNS